MGRLGKFWASSVGKKVVMGATGIILVGFLIVHMAGNLQLFLGAERFNAYSKLLKHDVIELTWVVRLTLLVSVILHAVSAYQLTMRNRAARPEPYAKRLPQVSTYASQTMRFGGVYLLFFIVYHIGHFTTGTFHPAYSESGTYGNVMIGFETWSTVLFYLGAMAFLSLHLYHGVWAAFRTLGVARPSGDPLKRQIAVVLAIVIAGGFSLVPLAVKLGLVH